MEKIKSLIPRLKNDDSLDSFWKGTIADSELRDLKTVLDDVIIVDNAEFRIEEQKDNLFGGYVVSIDTFLSDRILQKTFEFNEKSILNSTSKKTFKPIEVSGSGLELIEYLSLDCTSLDEKWHFDSEIKIDKNGYVIHNGEKTEEFYNSNIYSENKTFRLKIRNIICGDETIWRINL